MEIKVKKLHSKAVIPEYKSAGAAGFDIASVEEITLYRNQSANIRTGLAFEIPPGYELQIRPRSGLSAKTGLIAKNTIGTIDSDYRGEVMVCLHNLGKEYKICAGDRIAQGVVKKVDRFDIIEVDELSDTERGTGGFGSTGK
jgi:dUTP pyrophosphatase